MRKFEDLSRRAQKFYHNNPEAYIELQEIQQRGFRICSECQSEIALKQTECPGCGRKLRKPSYAGLSKWILGVFLFLSISSAITAIIVLGKVPCCDSSASLALLRKQFDHSLYATTFGLISSSASLIRESSDPSTENLNLPVSLDNSPNLSLSLISPYKTSLTPIPSSGNCSL